MPRGIPNVKIVEPEAGICVPEPPAPKMITMKLERHYRPVGDFEVLGHWQTEIRRKGPDGREHVLQAEGFIEDAMAPPPNPGADIPHKIWAGTVLRVPETEARTMNRAKIGVPFIED